LFFKISENFNFSENFISSSRLFCVQFLFCRILYNLKSTYFYTMPKKKTPSPFVPNKSQRSHEAMTDEQKYTMIASRIAGGYRNPRREKYKQAWIKLNEEEEHLRLNPPIATRTRAKVAEASAAATPDPNEDEPTATRPSKKAKKSG
jgi:hypothetical protein